MTPAYYLILFAFFNGDFTINSFPMASQKDCKIAQRKLMATEESKHFTIYCLASGFNESHL